VINPFSISIPAFPPLLKRRFSIPLDYATGPSLAVLILLAFQAMSLDDAKAGIIGDSTVQP